MCTAAGAGAGEPGRPASSSTVAVVRRSSMTVVLPRRDSDAGAGRRRRFVQDQPLRRPGRPRASIGATAGLLRVVREVPALPRARDPIHSRGYRLVRPGTPRWNVLPTPTRLDL